MIGLCDQSQNTTEQMVSTIEGGSGKISVLLKFTILGLETIYIFNDFSIFIYLFFKFYPFYGPLFHEHTPLNTTYSI